ncbi:MAG: NAD(P)-dependent oxidoreductase [Chloroflexi bacterium]|nr:NAD(P)-dependent oxidoreductase [Chloroflexota bacterium]MCY3581597.1 NAD(P)-dependent oxidoreductase [Chloroflexota bacterium]MCY3717400.1 NAD(P)-dependent oxidoreductase [Chloroflexota bacterium]MDE2650046.1 NAD(P)-dependent oxidoreductase [Chloroflexota bacterium]MXV93088.1 NAD(P)-dependent oxidoreductase [Chloroflexota bacterium]
MRVLMIGGAGRVGSMTAPYLKDRHSLTIFDRRPAADSRLRSIQGDICDYAALADAMAGQDALIYMAMGSEDWDSLVGIHSAYDINVKGLHLALYAAQAAGIQQAVYTSSMSVYENLGGRTFADENVLPDAHELYGFTKYLGEQVCQTAARNWDMHINALRLCFPTPDEELALVKPEQDRLATAASDVAAALAAALRFQARFQTFMISGDARHTVLNMRKARRLLSWSPQAAT